MMISQKLIEHVLRAIDPDDVIDLTAQLVKINSVWDPAAGTSEQPAAEHAARWAEKHGLQVNLEQIGRAHV
jgi:succinyl-diaminopimelate desuccinylase